MGYVTQNSTNTHVFSIVKRVWIYSNNENNFLVRKVESR